MAPDALFEFYKLYRGEMIEAFKLHRESLEHYLAFAVAVFAASIAGVTQLRDIGWLRSVVLAGPILDVMICLLGIRKCDRYYLGILERITILAKLETMLDINKVWNPGELKPGQSTLFPEDKFFLPARWIENTLRYSNSEAFRDSHMKSGVNSLARWTFRVAIGLNVILFFAALAGIWWPS